MLLRGVQITSFCHYLQGPAATQYLADLGAEVIKIEPIDGAYERRWSGANVFVNGVSGFYLAANRNKKSVALDLKAPEGRDIALELIENSQIVVENFRPGVLDRLGLGYEAIRARKPEIIYASATGYGTSGPDKDKPGQDLIIQARTGLMAGTGDRFSGPTAVGCAAVDQHGGALLALGVLAAYIKLLQTGQGTRVESSLFNAGIDLQTEALGNFVNGHFSREQYRRDARLASWFHEAPYGVYQAADGFVAISLNEPEKLGVALGEPSLAQYSKVDRYEQRDVAARAIADAVRKRTIGELIAAFDAHAVWYAPVRDFEDLQNDPQAIHNGVFRKVDVNGTEATLISHPVRYDGEAPDVRHIAFAPGQDSRDVLAGLGYASDRIDDLVARRIVGCPATKAA